MPGPFGVTTMLMIALAPFAIDGTEQVIVVEPLHVPALADTELSVTPAGRTSVMTTLVAGDGPLFTALSVYVMLWPSLIVVAEGDLVMDMSACAAARTRAFAV